MSICQRIKNGFAFSAAFDQFILLENAQLMRDRRLRHIKKFGDRTNAHFGLEQSVKYLNPRGIAEYLEKIRKIGEQFILRHFALHFTEQRGMIVFLVHVSTPSYEFVFI